MVPPPQWSKTTGMDPNFFEQGVFNPEGNFGNGQMKMVGLGGFGGGGGYAEGDPSSMGFQPGFMGGNPVFEGKKGLMNCGINQMTGEYMKDAQGNARCWYMPVTAGTNFIGGGGGLGAFVNPDADIIHYGVPMRFPTFKFKVPTVANMFVYGTIISLAVAVAFFVWRLSINKRMQKGKGPGVLAKLFHWDTWKLLGNKYPKGESKVFESDSELDYVDNDAVSGAGATDARNRNSEANPKPQPPAEEQASPQSFQSS